MNHVPRCDEETLRRLAKAIRKAALDQSIAFVFEEGMHRIVDQGQVFETPNGTITFRLFVNGGAHDSGVPKNAESAATVHPSIAADAGQS